MVALPAPESGSLLGYRVSHGELERSASCYGDTATKNVASLSQLEVQYDNEKSLLQDLRALNSSVKLGLRDAGDVKLVLNHLTVAKTTGVFDPLSACEAGIHDVVVWELRARAASLAGSSDAIQNVTAQVDVGPAKLDSAINNSGKETFKVIAQDVVFAYLTQRLKTEQSSEQTTWTEKVRPDDAVRLPDVPNLEHGLALKVMSLDRRRRDAFKLRLTGRQAMSAKCAKGPPAAALELSMGINDACHVSINDATGLGVRTSVSAGEVKVTTTLARTTRIGAAP